MHLSYFFLGLCYPILQDEGVQRAVAARGRSRGDRHLGGGGAQNSAGAEQDPPRPGPAEVSRRGVGLEEKARGQNYRAIHQVGLCPRLVPGGLHPG